MELEKTPAHLVCNQGNFTADVLPGGRCANDNHGEASEGFILTVAVAMHDAAGEPLRPGEMRPPRHAVVAVAHHHRIKRGHGG